MPFPLFNRHQSKFEPLANRVDRVHIAQDSVDPAAPPGPMNPAAEAIVRETAARVVQAKERGAARIAAFGAHAIKNGLAPVFQQLIAEGWFTHLATNGAGVIHDWEFAFQGQSSEHVAENVAAGRFGMWQETGHYLNLALRVGAYQGLGYGEAIGAFVENGGLRIPSEENLRQEINVYLSHDLHRAGAAIDLLDAVQTFRLQPGWISVEHPYKAYGLQAAAFQAGIPLTGHPMFGHDIIYAHPMSHGAAIGRAAERDFLAFAQAVTQLSGGVYVSLGSAVMSPMIFEKSLSMAQNFLMQRDKRVEDHFIAVVDLAESQWDWSQGEPPEDHPDYYLRYNKTFSRMGGTLRYASADNRAFLLTLAQQLHAAHMETEAAS